MDAVLVPVTLISVMAALIAGGLAWRLARHERRRSDARVAALAAELTALERTERPRPAAAVAAPDPIERPLRMAPDPGGGRTELFATAQDPPQSRGRMTTVVAVGGLVVGVAVAVTYWMNAPTAGAAETHRAAAAAAVPADASLELVSLTHARQGNDWTITGLVQNPAGGAPLEGVAAVALLFDGVGSFVGSGRTPLEVKTLLPGDESPFVISIKAAGRVERYRISFRTGDGQVVRHIDRRTNTPSS